MDLIIKLILGFLGITIGLTIGRSREKAHYKSIVEREQALGSLPTRVDETIPDGVYHDAKLVTGSIVIANDYFKSLVASIRTFFGGRLSSYESLLDRARREAVLRMKESAAAWGADEIVHVRLESSTLDEYGVEIFAFGTALKK